MKPQDRNGIERRVVLRGALASLAVGAAGCSDPVVDNADDVADDAKPADLVDEEPMADIFDSADFGGFGGLIRLGPVEDVLDEIESNNGFLYRPEGRAWVTAFPADRVDKAKDIYPEALHESLENGVIALYQKCPHLGCRVPECASSQKFECPCHGSQYSQVGEHVAGPSPRGMDFFASTIIEGSVVIDTGTIFEGLPVGTNVTGWEPTEEGLSCLGPEDS